MITFEDIPCEIRAQIVSLAAHAGPFSTRPALARVSRQFRAWSSVDAEWLRMRILTRVDEVCRGVAGDSARAYFISQFRDSVTARVYAVRCRRWLWCSGTFHVCLEAHGGNAHAYVVNSDWVSVNAVVPESLLRLLPALAYMSKTVNV